VLRLAFSYVKSGLFGPLFSFRGGGLPLPAACSSLSCFLCAWSIAINYCACVCLCVERWRATSLFLDGSSSRGGSSTAPVAGSNTPLQSHLSGCSRSCCLLFPLNLAAGGCAVVGRIYHASRRLAVPDGDRAA